MNRLISVILAVAMVSISFSLISQDASPEDITGPFVTRDGGYPLTEVVLDQQQWDSDYSITISSMDWCYQTFKPGISGVLDHISILIYDLAGIGYIQVDIHNTDQAGNLLGGFASYSFDAFVDGWWDISFDPAPTLSADTEYAILLSSPSSRSILWSAYGSPPIYPDGASYFSIDGGVLWNTAGADQTFKIYMDVPTGGIKKVAWHESGDWAWGVTGDSEHVYAYTRDTGIWSVEYSAVSGDIFHDIVYDDVRHMFYMVGESGGWPIAFTWHSASGFSDRGSPAVTGAFYGVEPCYGYGDYYFLAVGKEFGDGMALAAWFDVYGMYEIIGGFSANSMELRDATWDYENIGSYYIVGADSTLGTAAFYVLDNPGDSTAQDLMGFFNPGDYYGFSAIDWCPDFANHDYAIIVGSGPGAAAWKLTIGTLTPMISGFTGTLEGVNWFPDGAQAVIVGDNGGSGVIYTHSAGSDDIVSATHILPSGTGPLYGVACKGPSSPSSAIITGSGGGISYYPNALNQDTSITVNVAYPHLYWIGFNTTAGASRVEQQVPPDDWYQFSLAANYSQGWTNCEVIIQAWYDLGALGDASKYPAETAANRCLAFSLYYNPSTSFYTMTYPGGPEYAIGGYSDNILGGFAGQEIHEVRFAVYLGPQTRSANGNGFISGDVNTDQLKTNTLLDANSWDFRISVQDRMHSTANQTMYSEFGIDTMVSISVTGNPAANAPPGASDVPMTNPSLITYSANTEYWVNVSIPNVGLNGNPLATDNIPATDVAVANANILASPEYTELNRTDCPVGRAFQGANIPWCIWGNRTAAANPYMPAPANGTTAFGPWGSNYNFYHNPTGTTRLNWWVTVQATTKEGVYSALITLTIDT